MLWEAGALGLVLVPFPALLDLAVPVTPFVLPGTFSSSIVGLATGPEMETVPEPSWDELPIAPSSSESSGPSESNKIDRARAIAL